MKINILSLFLVKTKLFVKKIKIFLKIEKKEEPTHNKENEKTDDIYPLW
jgi:hypothetical protein